MIKLRFRRHARGISALFGIGLALLISQVGSSIAQPINRLVPLLDQAHPVTWWFAFKFNSASFPTSLPRVCPFGGNPQAYDSRLSQAYVYASNIADTLKRGGNALGTSDADPLGATYGEIYHGHAYFVVWNDQLYNDPQIQGCSTSCSAPWGHSKGIVAWSDDGTGLILQVTTPSWPGSGSDANPRKTDGNTLGCVIDDNVEVSQHFFALSLTHNDLVEVLGALSNASVVTDPNNPQLVRNGGPADVQAIVSNLGQQVNNDQATTANLSSGVELISKPSLLHVPPWQLVSAELGGVPLRVASWWATPRIPSTTSDTEISCWNDALPKPGAVSIATTGHWQGTAFGLTGGPGKNFNHAKIGVSTDSNHPYVIFGDMNQQGAIADRCGSSQDGRGGIFFVVNDPGLNTSVSALLAGDSAPTELAAPPPPSP
jgi:Deoxyribonuclease II